jgi:hypothetical protein
VWFEVSAHTGRAHFHAAADGGAPLGLSLPLELLQLSAKPPLPAALAQLLDALDARCAARPEAPAHWAAAARDRAPGLAPMRAAWAPPRSVRARRLVLKAGRAPCRARAALPCCQWAAAHGEG